MSRKIMKLIDPSTGQMQCKVCGSEHFASRITGNGQFFKRGSWQCDKGCTLDDLDKKELERNK